MKVLTGVKGERVPQPLRGEISAESPAAAGGSLLAWVFMFVKRDACLRNKTQTQTLHLELMHKHSSLHLSPLCHN